MKSYGSSGDRQIKAGADEEGLLPGRRFACRHLGNVLVLGLGVSGKALVEYLTPLIGSRVTSLCVLGGNGTDDNRAWASALKDRHSDECEDGRLVFMFDADDARAMVSEDAEEFDLCIASPGISVFSDMYANAASCSRSIIGEVEFAWRESASDSRWIAITGTNGKTTATSLTTHLLREAGMNAVAVGNIGQACIAQIAPCKDGKLQDAQAEAPIYVLEVSSFQLASIDRFVPDAAVMLGIKPDHVEWHRTYDHYVDSKMRLLGNMESAGRGTAILDTTNIEVRKRAKALSEDAKTGAKPSVIPIGWEGGVGDRPELADGFSGAAFVSPDNVLTVIIDGESHALCQVSELNIKGPHNMVNALASAAAALTMGVSDTAIREGLEGFMPLEHRIEPAGSKGSVSFFNDSKATNVDSAVCAIGSFPGSHLIVMLGGHDKMTPLDELVDACDRHACAVICYGEAKDRFFEAMSPIASEDIEVVTADGFDDAFDEAVRLAEGAESDDVTVLLSPACSSYDEFNSFEERGRRFKEKVQDLIG